MTVITRFFVVVGLILLICSVVARAVFAIELSGVPIKPSSFLIVANIAFTLGILVKK